MESNQVQMYQISKEGQEMNKDSVVLRALAADPNRYKPLAQHAPTSENRPPPSQAPKTVSSEPVPTSMYTLESRYRSIPEKVLPKTTGPRMYYINSENEQREPSPPLTKEERDIPMPREKEQKPLATVSLEPQVISQPILYSIIGDKRAPIHNEQPTPVSAPVPVPNEIPLPILYTITGQVQRPTLQGDKNLVPMASSPTDRSAILYSITANPKSKIIVEDPSKAVPVVPVPLTKTASLSSSTVPSFYLLVGQPHIPSSVPQPLKEVPSPQQQPVPILYSIVGQSRVPSNVPEPLKVVPSLARQSAPILYSIVGRPTVVPLTKELTTVNLIPPTEHVKASSSESAPILYTIVGEKHTPADILTEQSQPPEPIKKQVNNSTLYTVIGDPKKPQTMVLPQKPQQQPLLPSPPPSKPTFYPLVGKPHSPTRETIEKHQKPLMRSRIPLPQIGTTRRRSIEQESAPEADPADNSPPRQKKPRQRRLKEPVNPRSEIIFIPLADQDRPRVQRQPRAVPWQTSPGNLHRRPHQIPQYDPLQLPDYISPYAYYPSKPYHERTCHPTSLPIVKSRRPERKSRAQNGESPPRSDRKHLSEPWVPHSLDRQPTDRKRPPRTWDYENHSHTDIDDDYYEPDAFSKHPSYRGHRIRTPWVAVW
ncbi:unnamed protein product [Adineta ricciae]|uniref:Uncharacterized protein n=1 Tax=Adineta ricciae TaxID=249248 RepID=A0A814URI0_ADIRI|nr:unnamed protein product [Adineta ricciae]CAF1179190.1 unnamed protein product [Adineta ricciae]